MSDLRQQLATLLDSRSENDSMRADETQAFLLALLSGPDALDEQHYLDEIAADGAFSDTEKAQLQALCTQLITELKENLSKNQMPELWLYPDENGQPDYFHWCNAYLFALDWVETDWFEAADNEDFEDLFYPLMALGGVYDDDDVIHISERELAQLANEIPAVVRDIYRFWQVELNKPQTVRREGAKVGRNDPCPCHSGKKFKACCDKR